MNDVVTWEQYVYGKLLRRPGGPICDGSEHNCTGLSPAFPRSLLAQCAPTQVLPGLQADFSWSDYPWVASGGGVVATTRMVGSDPWVVVGRICGRSESGEGVPGRMYTQAHFLACPMEEWRPGAVAMLGEVLRAEGMLEADSNLPRLTTFADFSRGPLPDDWASRVQRGVEVVMSGQCIAVQDWKIAVPDGLERVALLLHALPPAVRWRLPWAVGAIRMDEHFAYAFGMAAWTRIREVGGNLRGYEEADLSVGKRYMARLRDVAKLANTVGDLAAAVDEILPARVVATAEWRHAAAFSVGALHEMEMLDRVRDWLRTGSGARPVLKGTTLRGPVLRLVLDHLSARGIELLPEVTDAEWRDEWEKQPRGSVGGSLASVLGYGTAATVDDVARLAELALVDPLAQMAVKHCDAALVDDLIAEINLDRWGGMLWPADGRPREWMHTWYESRASAILAWVCITDGPRALGSSASAEAYRPLHELFHNGALSVEKVAAMLAPARQGAAVEALLDRCIERLMHKAPLMGFRLASAACVAFPKWRVVTLMSSATLAPAEMADLLTAARALMESKERAAIEPPLRKLFLAHANQFPQKERQALLLLFADTFDQPAGWILQGVLPVTKRTNKPIPDGTIVNELVARMPDAAVAERLMEMVRARKGPLHPWAEDAAQMLRHLLGRLVDTKLPEGPPWRLLWDYVNRHAAGTGVWPPEMDEQAVEVALAAPKSFPPSEVFPYVRDPKALLDLAVDVKPPEFGEGVFEIIANEADPERRKKWIGILNRGRWYRAPGWRLLWQLFLPPHNCSALDGLDWWEHDLAARLSPELRVRLVTRRVSISTLGDRLILTAHIVAAELDEASLIRLLNRAAAVSEVELVLRILVYAIGQAPPPTREDAVRKLNASPKGLLKSYLQSRSENPLKEHFHKLSPENQERVLATLYDADGSLRRPDPRRLARPPE